MSTFFRFLCFQSSLLLISLFLISNASAGRGSCGESGKKMADAYTGAKSSQKRARVPHERQVAPYIYQILSNGEDPQVALKKLKELEGLSVQGSHKSYPMGENALKRQRVEGKILSINTVEGSIPGLYEMKLMTDKGEEVSFFFSSSYSPSFSSLHIVKGTPSPEMSASLKQASEDYQYPFDILSIGLDTPEKTRLYKQSLKESGAIAFYGKRSDYYEFSNFYERPIVIGGQIWPSSEHYFQGKKFVEKLSHGGLIDTPNVMEVRVAESPGKAAKLGRDRSKPLRKDWEEVKEDVMYQALIAKFTQHPDLFDVLMSTGDAHLVEHTERDIYWGDAEDGSGKAMLGELLMRLRRSLQKGFIPGHELPISAEWGVLYGQIQTNHYLLLELAKEVATSDLRDLEKLNRLQMIRNFSSYIPSFKSRTSWTTFKEWMEFLNERYPEDFRYKLVRASLGSTGGNFDIGEIRELNISKERKLELYKLVAQNQVGHGANSFAASLPELGLENQSLRGIYLNSLTFHSSVAVIRDFPEDLVDDAFIQEVLAELNLFNFPCRFHLTTQEGEEWRGQIVEELLKAAEAHGLFYVPTFASDGAVFDTKKYFSFHSPRNRDPIVLKPVSHPR